MILLAGILLAIGIASSKLSSRMGLPVLVLFLLVGMVARASGIGQLQLEDYTLAHGVASLALAMILFDGGLRTDLGRVKSAVAPALSLATFGVLLTAGLVAAVSVWVLDLPLWPSLLLGSIISSTDAAAVFAVLRSKGLRVRSRLGATLEIESASNDPMAIFLTVACLEILLGRITPGIEVAWFFLRQMLLGGLIGWGLGRVAVIVVRRIRLDVAGLYPVFTGAAALLAYGVAAVAGGSGFLAVYVAGIVIGTGSLPFGRAIYLFHDGLAWLSQITLFVMLGLLSEPSRLLAAAGPGLLIAAALVFVARPVAVFLSALPFRFSLRDILFLSWGGLKGAVPIVLATYPLLAGLDGALALFDLVFFVVFVSAVTQGWSLPYLAKRLGLRRPVYPQAPAALEITSLGDVEGDIVEYRMANDCRAAGHRIRDLAMPDGALVAMISRGNRIIPPRGSTQIQPGDHVFVLLQPRLRRVVDRIFRTATQPPSAAAPAVPAPVEFRLRGTTRLADLEEFYGIRIEGDAAGARDGAPAAARAPGDAGSSATLEALLRSRIGDRLAVGSSVRVGSVTLTIREMVEGRIETVGLAVDTAPEAAADATAGTAVDSAPEAAAGTAVDTDGGQPDAVDEPKGQAS